MRIVSVDVPNFLPEIENATPGPLQERGESHSSASIPDTDAYGWRTKDVFWQNLDAKREVLISYAGLGITSVAAAFVLAEISSIFYRSVASADFLLAFKEVVFLLITTSLILGNVVYQVSRAGYFSRLFSHRRTSRRKLEKIYDREAPPIVFLIPSYREEIRVIEQSLLSCALQDYPNRRVVLLLDDPPAAAESAARTALARSRALPARIEAELAAPQAFFERERREAVKRFRQGTSVLEETRRLSKLYITAAEWFEDRASTHEMIDHGDKLFVDVVYKEPAIRHRQRAEMLARLVKRSRPLGKHDALRNYRFLAALFTVSLESFERKTFENLSHEPNKAMNLNSYIGLIGKHFKIVTGQGGKQSLHEVSMLEAELSVPKATYLMTLDADSIIVSDYALRLSSLMESPSYSRVAVVQTPYSAVPAAPGTLERAAGAMTDLQYIVHQGFTQLGATFWVGANALLRKSALDDICVERMERGFPVLRYIQDRTVIEDTESSIDLVVKGWTLRNYPERLSFSTTPPDFGSLLIQRRRWANGGLIILPKLITYFLKECVSGDRRTTRSQIALAKETIVRFHYLTSLATSSFGLLLLFGGLFTENLTSFWLPLTAIPYFLLYARDLRHAGYSLPETFRVYALNLLLLPVHLGGVLKSLEQAWTGKQIPFTRTPKVVGITAAPAFYIIAEYCLAGYFFVNAAIDGARGHWGLAAIGVVTGLILSYAIAAFIGWKQTVATIFPKTFGCEMTLARESSLATE